MVSTRRRNDPYKGFKFRALPVAALAGIAVFGIVKKLLAKLRPPAPVEEIPAGARPIEGVGTSTVGFVGTVPKDAPQPRPKASRARKGPRKRTAGTT